MKRHTGTARQLFDGIMENLNILFWNRGISWGPEPQGLFWGLPQCPELTDGKFISTNIIGLTYY